jgi:hypothetical protein
LGQVIGRCVATTPAPNVAEQNRAEGVSPNTVLCSLAAYWRRTVTDLLNAVCPYTIIFYFIIYNIFYITIYFKILFAPKTNPCRTWTYGRVGIMFYSILPTPSFTAMAVFNEDYGEYDKKNYHYTE